MARSRGRWCDYWGREGTRDAWTGPAAGGPSPEGSPFPRRPHARAVLWPSLHSWGRPRVETTQFVFRSSAAEVGPGVVEPYTELLGVPACPQGRSPALLPAGEQSCSGASSPLPPASASRVAGCHTVRPGSRSVLRQPCWHPRDMEEVRRSYSRLCKESGAEPQETVLQRLHELPRGRLDLATQSLTADTCAALGKLLQKEAFVTELVLSDCMLSEEGGHRGRLGPGSPGNLIAGLGSSPLPQGSLPWLCRPPAPLLLHCI